MSRRREAAEEARARPDDPPCATGTCGEPCLTRDFRPLEVDVDCSETIANGSDPAWNQTFGWKSRFMLTVRRSPCSVLLTMRLKIRNTYPDGTLAAWKTAIESKWNGKVKFVCPDRRCAGACADGYPVSVEVQFVDSNEHFTVRAQGPDAVENGRKGLKGTTSMTGWGYEDRIDITHEFGHMIGAPEEYFTTDGIDYSYWNTRQGFRDPQGGNMNNPANDPQPQNYELLRKKAETIIGRGTVCQTDPPVNIAAPRVGTPRPPELGPGPPAGSPRPPPAAAAPAPAAGAGGGSSGGAAAPASAPAAAASTPAAPAAAASTPAAPAAASAPAAPASTPAPATPGTPRR